MLIFSCLQISMCYNLVYRHPIMLILIIWDWLHFSYCDNLLPTFIEKCVSFVFYIWVIVKYQKRFLLYHWKHYDINLSLSCGRWYIIESQLRFCWFTKLVDILHFYYRNMRGTVRFLPYKLVHCTNSSIIAKLCLSMSCGHHSDSSILFSFTFPYLIDLLF